MHTTLVFELCSLFLVRDFIILVEIVSNFTVCIWRTLLSNWIKIHTPYSIAYNTCGYFASRVVFFRTPQGRRKIRAMSKFPLVFYAKPSNKRLIIPPQKKDVILQLASIFLVRVFRKILIPSLRMTLTMSKMFALIICQSIEWKVNYSTAKNVILASISMWFSSAGSSSSTVDAPFASAGIRPVVSRFNQDTTLFCAFSWPYMVK